MLKITLITEDSPPETRRFAGSRVRLGRGGDNDWVLPDPNRRLSRQHCVVEWTGTTFLVTDTSANGVFVSGADSPVGRDRTIPVPPDTYLTMAGLRLELGFEAPAEDVTEFVGDETAFIDADSTAFLAGGPAGTPATLSPTPPQAGPESDSTWLRAPTIIEARPSATARPSTDAAQPVPAQSAEDEARIRPGDAEPAQAPQPAPEAGPDSAPAETQSTTEAQSPTDDRSHPTARSASATPSDGADRMLAAFLEGAGLPREAVAEMDQEALMRKAGEMVRAAVTGLTHTLQARADVKAELYLDGTVLRPAGNNPLKFVADETEALKIALGPGMPAFMPGPRAIADGLKDIESHTHALMEGLRIALAALVREFEPDQLKTRLARASVVEKAVPALLRARYWELYEQTYAQMAKEIEDGFHTNYWNAYAKAYDEHCRRQQ